MAFMSDFQHFDYCSVSQVYMMLSAKGLMDVLCRGNVLYPMCLCKTMALKF
jgi:hypothetical protein